MTRFESLSDAEVVSELQRYADDVEREGRTSAPECMREAARRLNNLQRVIDAMLAPVEGQAVAP